MEVGLIRPLLGPGWVFRERHSRGGWISSCGRGVGERRLLRVLVARSFQCCSLRGERLRSVVGLRRFQPPDDSVPLHFHAHFCPLAWPGYSPISVAHGLIRALTLALSSGLVRWGVHLQDKMGVLTFLWCMALKLPSWAACPYRRGWPLCAALEWRWRSAIGGLQFSHAHMRNFPAGQPYQDTLGTSPSAPV